MALVFAVLCAQNLFAQKHELKFNADGEFKIVQFTDLHFSCNSPKADTTLAVIASVTASENPDLIIFSGDIVTDVPSYEGWYKLGALLEQIAIPWAITLGNHDDEPSIGPKEIFELVEKMPYFTGEKGPASISGYGNHVLLISGHDSDKPAGAVYCMDSHGFGKISKMGGYDWFHFDQIQWYREQSERITAANGDIPLPSLAFFHIPLPEYKELGADVVGSRPGRVASPDVNSGMFMSMIDRNDILGTFVGHDHNNDFIGKYKDIALAYGRVSGADASGRLERGGRIVVMYENQYKFDTWIRTRKGKEFEYSFPNNKILEEGQTVDYLPALNINPQRHGLRYTYYTGDFGSTDDVLKAKPRESGTTGNFNIDFSPARDWFGVVYEGFINIAEKDAYSFYVVAYDEAKLYIDDKLVVEAKGPRVNGIVGLDKGFHKIKVVFYENDWGEHLQVGYSAKNLRETIIPHYVLFSE